VKERQTTTGSRHAFPLRDALMQQNQEYPFGIIIIVIIIGIHHRTISCTIIKTIKVGFSSYQVSK
jgi:predicted RND superfamily exporter protein